MGGSIIFSASMLMLLETCDNKVKNGDVVGPKNSSVAIFKKEQKLVLTGSPDDYLRRIK